MTTLSHKHPFSSLLFFYCTCHPKYVFVLIFIVYLPQLECKWCAEKFNFVQCCISSDENIDWYIVSAQ